MAVIGFLTFVHTPKILVGGIGLPPATPGGSAVPKTPGGGLGGGFVQTPGGNLLRPPTTPGGTFISELSSPEVSPTPKTKALAAFFS